MFQVLPYPPLLLYACGRCKLKSFRAERHSVGRSLTGWEKQNGDYASKLLELKPRIA